MMQSITSNSCQAFSVNLMKSGRLRHLVWAGSFEAVSDGSKRYLGSDVAADDQILLRIDSPLKMGNAVRISQASGGRPDWMEMNLNQTTLGKRSPVMVVQHVKDGPYDLASRVSHADDWRDQPSKISIDLGIVDWHVRRRDFVEIGSKQSSNRFLSTLPAFVSDRYVESIGSRCEHRLDFAGNPESDRAPGVTTVPGHLDLVTRSVGRRNVVETGKTWAGTDDSNDVDQRAAWQQLDWNTIPVEHCRNVIDGKSAVPANLDLVTWCVRRPQLIEVAKNRPTDDPMRSSMVDCMADRPLTPVCNLELDFECLDGMPRLERSEVCPTSLHALPLSRLENVCDVWSVSVERTRGGTLPNANQYDLSPVRNPQACNVDGTAFGIHPTDGQSEMVLHKPWNTARDGVQDGLHSLAGFEADATFAMVSPPSRCAVQFATCSYLRGNGGFPNDWSIPVMETVGGHAEKSTSLKSLFLNCGASIASDVETDTRFGSIRLGEYRKEAVRPGVTIRNRNFAVSMSMDALAERDDPQRKTIVSSAHAVNNPYHVSAWHGFSSKLPVTENTQQLPWSTELNEVIHRAVCNQQVCEAHFPPLSTFELPQVIISGPVRVDSILDGVGGVTIGIWDQRLNSAGVSRGIAGDRNVKPGLERKTGLRLDAKVTSDSGEYVTKVALRQKSFQREAIFPSISVLNDLNANKSLAELWGVGAMKQPTETCFLVMTDKRPLNYLEDRLQAILCDEQFVCSSVQSEAAEWNGVSHEVLAAGCTFQSQVRPDLKMAKSGNQKNDTTRSQGSLRGNLAAIATAQQSIQMSEASGIPTYSDMRGVWAA
jgi:hypothetical protein